MKDASLNIVRRLSHETRGAEIAEAAAVLPVMFMVLLGIFWFGQAFSIYGAITRAAQEGARAGSVPICTTCGNPSTYSGYATAAQNAVNSSLIASNLNPSLMPSTTPPNFNFCPSHVTACGPGQACVQLPVYLNPPNSTDCGISVVIQYPFTFWLPFTSLNNQQILITASASARMEAN